jgi:hypothetical protein
LEEDYRCEGGSFEEIHLVSAPFARIVHNGGECLCRG